MSKRTAGDSERRDRQRTLYARGQGPEVKSINWCVLPRTRDTGDYDSVATGEGVLRMLQRTRDAGGTHRIQVIVWQSVLQTGLWHSDPFQRSLRDIPAWRRGLLSAFWHGDPQLKHF